MKQHTLKIEILDHWHIGSGIGLAGYIDSLSLKDERGLPFIPGRSIKGLLRECLRSAEDFGHAPQGTTDRLFGAMAGGDTGSTPGSIHLGNACLDQKIADWLAHPDHNKLELAQLFTVIGATALKDGVARDESLRLIELVVPMTLFCTITCPEDDLKWIKLAAPLLRGVGAHRNRGLGRCITTLQ